MKPFYKKLFWFAAGTMVVGVLALVLLQGTDLLVGRFKQTVVVELKKATGREVTIDRLEGGIFGSITLHGVVLGPPRTARGDISDKTLVTLKVDRLVVSFSIFDLLFNHSSVVNSLTGLEFINPDIGFYLPGKKLVSTEVGPAVPQGARLTVKDLESLLLQLPRLPVRVSVKGGRARLLSPVSPGAGALLGEVSKAPLDAEASTPTASYSLEDIRGSLDFRDLKNLRLLLRARAEGLPQGHLKVDGRLSPDGGDAQIKIEFKNLSIKPIYNFALGRGHWLSVDKGQADGSLVLTSVPARRDQWIEGLQVSGSLSVKEVDSALRDHSLGLNGMEGRLQMLDRSLRLKGLRFEFGGGQWTGGGTIADLREPEINMRLSTPGMPTERLATLFPVPSGVSFTGKTGALITVEGRLPRPQAVAVLNGKGIGVAGFTFERLEAYLRAESHGLWMDRFEAKVDGADLSAKGTFSIAATADGPRLLTPTAGFHASLRGYPAGPLASRYGLTGISGEFNADLDFRGKINDLDWKGTVRVPTLKIGNEVMTHVRGSVALERGKFNSALVLDWRNWKKAELVLGGNLEPDRLVFETLKLEKDGRVLASAAGVMNQAKPREIYFKATAKDVDLTELPVRHKLLEHLNGKVSIEGQVSGVWEAPRLSLVLDGTHLKTSEGMDLPVKARATLNEGKVTIEEATIRGTEVRVKGEWDTRKSDAAFTAELGMASLPPLVQWWGGDSFEARSGNLTGRAAWFLRNGKPEGEVNLEGEDVDLGHFKAQQVELVGEYDADLWEIKRFSSRQADGGKAVLEGKISRTQAGEVNSSVELAAWQWDSRKIDAKVRLDGSSPTRELAWWKKISKSTNDALQSGKVNGILTVDGFRVNGIELPAIVSVWTWFESEILVESFTFGGILASGRWPLDSTGLKVVDLTVKKEDFRSAMLLLAGHDSRLEHPVYGNMTWTRDGIFDKVGLDLRGLAGGDSSGKVKGTLSLQRKKKWKDSILNLELNLEDAPLDAVRRLVPDPSEWMIQARGVLTGEVMASGSVGEPVFSLKQSIAAPGYGLWNFRRAEIEAQGAPGNWKLSSLELIDGEIRLNLKNFSLRRDAQGHWKAEGEIGTTRFPVLTMFKTDSWGRLKFDSHAGGDQWEASLDMETLNLNRAEFGKTPIKLDYQDGRLRIKAGDAVNGVSGMIGMEKDRTTFEELIAYEKEGGKVTFTGSSSSADGLDAAMKVDKFPVNYVTRLLDWKQDWTGTAWGNVTYRGLPGQVRIVVSTKFEDGTVNELKYDLVTGTVLVDKGIVQLDPQNSPVWLTRKGVFDFQVGGTIPIGEETGKAREMDLWAEMKQGDLAVLEYLEWIETASGPTDMKLKITGTLAYPEVSGKVETRGGSMKTRAMLKEISDIQGVLFLDKNLVHAHRLDCRIGDESQRLYVEAGPKAPWVVQLERFSVGPMNLKLSSGKKGIRFDHTDDLVFLKGRAFPDLMIGGSFDEPIVEGKLRFEDGEVIFPAVIKPHGKKAPGPGLVERTNWNLDLELGRNLEYRKEEIRVELAEGSKMKIRGPWEELGVLGEIKIGRGQIFYLSSAFDIDDTRDSKVLFRGDAVPVLDIWARQLHRRKEIKIEGEEFVREMDVEIVMHAHGPSGEVNVSFTASEPRLTQAQITSLIGFGEDVTAVTGSGERVQKAVAGWLVGKGVGWGTRRVEKIGQQLGILDRIRVKVPAIERAFASAAQTPGASTTPDAGATPVVIPGVTPGADGTVTSTDGYHVPGRPLVDVEVGKYLGKNFYLGAAARVEERGIEGTTGVDTEYQLEYQINRGTKLKGKVIYDNEFDRDYRASIETGKDFGNYNPRQRRLERELGLIPTLTATLTPRPSQPLQ